MNAAIRSESRMMVLARALGLESVAWSLRRLHCPVPKSALVLEVGSGGNPYYRANVLCDAYLDTRERHFVPLVHDRPTVLGFVENLPFLDDTFDFVIASHVLEHSPDPDRFLAEVQRVGRAGYIEVPDAFMERLSCYLDHRLEITEREGTLQIRKKPAHVTDPQLADLFEDRAASVFHHWVARYPFHFHVRYYWTKEDGPQRLRYSVLNPEVDATWPAPAATPRVRMRANVMTAIKTAVLWLARATLSQRSRNRGLRIDDYLQCPRCRSADLRPDGNMRACGGCKARYAVLQNGIVDFSAPHA